MSSPNLTAAIVVGDSPGAPNVGIPAVAGSVNTLRTDLRQQYVAGGGNQWLINYAKTLAFAIDDLTQTFGDDLYDRMMLEAQVAATINGFRSAILEDGLTLRPAIDDEDADGYDQATALVETYQRVLDDLETPLDEVLWDLSASVYTGNRVAELVYDDTPSSGLPRLRVKAIKVKPRHATAFVVDVFNTVLGLMARVPGVGNQVYTGTLLTAPDKAPNLIPREKFLVASFRPTNGDPRGTSVLRPAYDEWNRLQQIKLDYLKFLSQFASPSLVGITAPEAQELVVTDSYGNPTGAVISPEQAMADALSGFKNGTFIAVAAGADVKPINVGNARGAPFLDAMALCYQMIAKAVLSQTLATEEGQHQARAAAEVHQDTRDTIIRQAKRALERAFYRDVLVPMVRYNQGEAATRLTPKPTLGVAEQQDFSSDATAIAALETSGFIDPSQKPGIDKRLNLPPRAPDWQQQAAQRAALVQQSTQPAPGQQDDGKQPTPIQQAQDARKEAA